MAESRSANKSRGFLLGFFLVIWMIDSGVNVLHYLFGGSSLLKSQPDLPFWGLPLLGLLTLIEFICYVALWKWRRWGVYGAVGASFIILLFKLIFFDSQPQIWSPEIQFFVSNADAMNGGLGAIAFLIWLIIFGLLMKANWQNLE